jgi:hypothetical protein
MYQDDSKSAPGEDQAKIPGQHGEAACQSTDFNGHDTISMGTVVDTRRLAAWRALMLVGVIFGILAAATLIAVIENHLTGGQHLSMAKRVEYVFLLAMALGFGGLVSWHLATSDVAQLGVDTVKSAAVSGRLFFFTSYWFTLKAPEVAGKPFLLSYSASSATGEKPLGTILLQPGAFTIGDIKQQRPTHPKHRCFRLGGDHVHTGAAFKYVMACSTDADTLRWRIALEGLAASSFSTAGRREVQCTANST